MVNQVQAVFSNTSIAGSDEECVTQVESGSHVTVALGNTWAHTVNTRLTLQYIDNVTRQVGAKLYF